MPAAPRVVAASAPTTPNCGSRGGQATFRVAAGALGRLRSRRPTAHAAYRVHPRLHRCAAAGIEPESAAKARHGRIDSVLQCRPAAATDTYIWCLQGFAVPRVVQFVQPEGPFGCNSVVDLFRMCTDNHAMILECSQIRAARALLNWSQSDLARAAQMANSSIKNVENENTSARRDTILQIKDALEANGVEFSRAPASSSRPMSSPPLMAAPPRPRFMKVSTRLPTPVPIASPLVLGLDEPFAVQYDGLDRVRDHNARLKNAGITQKILASEGTTEFLGDASCYRLLPRERFGKTVPVYIYGNKVASLHRHLAPPHDHHRGQGLRRPAAVDFPLIVERRTWSLERRYPAVGHPRPEDRRTPVDRWLL